MSSSLHSDMAYDTSVQDERFHGLKNHELSFLNVLYIRTFTILVHFHCYSLTTYVKVYSLTSTYHIMSSKAAVLSRWNSDPSEIANSKTQDSKRQHSTRKPSPLFSNFLAYSYTNTYTLLLFPHSHKILFKTWIRICPLGTSWQRLHRGAWANPSQSKEIHK